MNRRRFLKGAGAAGAVGAVGAGGVVVFRRRSEEDPSDDADPEVPTERAVRHADEFRRVVNAANAGADPEGNEPINDFLETYANDDTLLSFPAGTYRINPVELSEFSKLGISAAGNERITFVPDSDCERGDPYLLFERIDDLLLDGIDFDFRRRGAGGPIYLFCRGDATVKNVRMAGSCFGQISKFRIDVRDEEGSALVENVVANNADENPSLTGIYVGREHAGSITFRECELEGYSDNGLYASSPGVPDGRDGTVHVIGGIFKNNNVANVRLGSTGATARGVTIVSDSIPPSGGSVNARGIRLREKDDQLIEDCEIYIGENAAYGFGAIVFHRDAGGSTVRDTKITVDRDSVPAINALGRSEENVSSTPLMFENLTIDGAAAEEYAISIDGRDGTVFRSCDITQTGSERGGIHINDTTGCQIIDSRIDVTGTPIDSENSNTMIQNSTIVTPDGSRTIENLEVQNDVVTPSGDP